MKENFIILLIAAAIILAVQGCRNKSDNGEIDFSTARNVFISNECDRPGHCKRAHRNINKFRPAYIQDVTPRSARMLMRIHSKDAATCSNTDVTFELYELQKTKRNKPQKIPALFKTETRNSYIDLARAGDGGMPRCELMINVSGLKPATIYRYSAKAAGLTLAADAQFRTFPEAGDASRELHFMAVGDTSPSSWGAPDPVHKPRNYFYAVNNVMQLLSRTEPVNLAIIMGDLDNKNDGQYWSFDHHIFGAFNAYASPEYLALTGMRKTFNLHTGYGAMMSGIPFYVTPGNHDCQKWGHRGGAQPVFDNFVLPVNGDPCKELGGCGKHDPEKNHHPESYYSFDAGNVHFVSLNIIGESPDQTNWQYNCSMPDWHTGDPAKWHHLNEGSTMIRWLKRDLLRTPEDRWRIVFFHAGYAYGNQREQDGLFRLFRKLGVDAVLFGHNHWYDTGHKEGVLWFLSGTGGYGDDRGDSSHDPSFMRFVIKGRNMLMSRFGFDFKKNDCRPDPYLEFINDVMPPASSTRWCGFRNDFYPTRPRELDRMMFVREKTGNAYNTRMVYHDFYKWDVADLATPKTLLNPPSRQKSKVSHKNAVELEDIRCENTDDCHERGYAQCWKPEGLIFKKIRGFCID
ncbi:MAG: hypothetical protein A2583_05510 [Bdellovibrionales bacterium RIFOXYD1_FULL_53_11]|nr:MAG: hypothetical protein A2583_05510 [Bdellovibrionales bacterium RIFOXYD1_FULL_53_11]